MTESGAVLTPSAQKRRRIDSSKTPAAAYGRMKSFFGDCWDWRDQMGRVLGLEFAGSFRDRGLQSIWSLTSLILKSRSSLWPVRKARP